MSKANWQTHCMWFCLSMRGWLFQFPKTSGFVYLCGMHLFHTWLTVTLHRRPGSNEVQRSTAHTHTCTRTHMKRLGYTATKAQKNRFTWMDKKLYRHKTSIDAWRTSTLPFYWMRQPVYLGYVSHAFKSVHEMAQTHCTITDCCAHSLCLSPSL